MSLKEPTSTNRQGNRKRRASTLHPDHNRRQSAESRRTSQNSNVSAIPEDSAAEHASSVALRRCAYSEARRNYNRQASDGTSKLKATMQAVKAGIKKTWSTDGVVKMMADALQKRRASTSSLLDVEEGNEEEETISEEEMARQSSLCLLNFIGEIGSMLDEDTRTTLGLIVEGFKATESSMQGLLDSLHKKLAEYKALDVDMRRNSDMAAVFLKELQDNILAMRNALKKLEDDGSMPAELKAKLDKAGAAYEDTTLMNFAKSLKLSPDTIQALRSLNFEQRHDIMSDASLKTDEEVMARVRLHQQAPSSSSQHEGIFRQLERELCDQPLVHLEQMVSDVEHQYEAAGKQKPKACAIFQATFFSASVSRLSPSSPGDPMSPRRKLKASAPSLHTALRLARRAIAVKRMGEDNRRKKFESNASEVSHRSQPDKEDSSPTFSRQVSAKSETGSVEDVVAEAAPNLDKDAVAQWRDQKEEEEEEQEQEADEDNFSLESSDIDAADVGDIATLGFSVDELSDEACVGIDDAAFWVVMASPRWRYLWDPLPSRGQWPVPGARAARRQRVDADRVLGHQRAPPIPLRRTDYGFQSGLPGLEDVIVKRKSIATGVASEALKLPLLAEPIAPTSARAQQHMPFGKAFPDRAPMSLALNLSEMGGRGSTGGRIRRSRDAAHSDTLAKMAPPVLGEKRGLPGRRYGAWKKCLVVVED